MTKQKDTTQEQDFELLDELEDALENVSDDANNMELLEVIADVTGQSLTEVHEKYLELKSAGV